MGNSGILFNHAYGIQQVKEVDGLMLVRIRNPWGQGEWTGKFADEDEAWDDHKGLKEKLNYVFKNDGNWWMKYDDFCAHFNKLYLCKIFPSTWSQYSIAGEWAGNSAGGPYPVEAEPEPDNHDGPRNDTNDKWFNNPQFRLSVSKKTNLILSLMQEDVKVSKRPYIPVNFLVVRVKSKRDRLWEIEKKDIVLEASGGLQRFGQREITKNCTLLPEYDKKPCHYMIIPNTEDCPDKKEQERPFFLRVFSSEPMELVQMPDTIEQQFKNKWS
jgi:calpain, invertebrate